MCGILVVKTERSRRGLFALLASCLWSMNVMAGSWYSHICKGTRRDCAPFLLPKRIADKVVHAIW